MSISQEENKRLWLLGQVLPFIRSQPSRLALLTTNKAFSDYVRSHTSTLSIRYPSKVYNRTKQKKLVCVTNLGSFSNLKSLAITGDFIPKSLASQLLLLSNLEALRICLGAAKDSDFEFLPAMTQLKHLCIDVSD
eukprot:Awhi_evm1s7040